MPDALSIARVLPVIRAVTLTALVVAPAAAEPRFPPGSPESKVVLILAASAFVRSSCPNLELDGPRGVQAVNALGIRREVFMGPALTPDVNALLEAYHRDPVHACEALEMNFGPSGDLLPGLLRKLK
ncbi:hypothetical protein [Methylobacterium oxalidis]|uniref:Uncharacterized protein n=1 Tax=Methylobacterium oxalidis TaxID=944322 RepID=A0A512JDK6_9HYPH|nr:hypothetical protein [Methylobacterium oxalidis]GEP08033.1 hypothetical protein MOX02_60710 [Methylobacterium oxalidis]GJE35842.1 hypothetical protein LDDCCGHA_6063 [Methylobacterium oxalidis]GLS63837.1 hypothetical protein GCM10007888_22180 [Methylobacterium oxalidis]